LTDFGAVMAKEKLEEVTKTLSVGTGKIMQPMRVALTGLGGGPDLMMIMEIIGKDETIRRIEYALQTFKVKVA
jgi:glutamyl-tRNA synthetase